jgi:O-succinylbenzoic acid--CoA ligase
MVVEGWLQRAAAARPGGVALQTSHGCLSYAELLACASAGAAELAARGAAPGRRVAIALPPGLAFAQALHACLLLGAVAVPVDLRLLGAERERIAAGAVVRVEEPLSTVGGGRNATGSARSGGDRAGAGADPAAAERYLGARHDLAATAVVIHTSGTTSAPKPIELTYGNFLWSALGSAVALGLDPRERWLCALPLAHVGGLSILLRCAIYATTAVVHERFDTDAVLDALREQGITLVSVVATTLQRLLDAGLERPPSLRCALTGGGPVPPALLSRARAAGVPVSLTYGLTEACSQVTTSPVGATAGRSEGGGGLGGDRGMSPGGYAGPPLFCTRLRIANASLGAQGEPDEPGAQGEPDEPGAQGEPDEPGAQGVPEDGEIMVAGPTVAPGSLGPDGWLHTGDLGAFDEHGRLHVTGRKADTIVSGGENVAPAEVEAVLEAHPDVLEAAVLGRADERWGEAVTAIVVARPGAVLEGEALRAHCARDLAAHKVPKRVSFAHEPLPRTRSGKLLRKELQVVAEED